MSLRSNKTNNTSPQRAVYSRPRYSHVTLVSGCLFGQLSIDHNMDVHYQVKKRLYLPWKPSE